MELKIGDRAPGFEALDEEGKPVKLSDFSGKTNVVLYFYPKAETPGCTAEAKCFRDNWDPIVSLGATILGVSSDSEVKQKAFKEHHKLQFTLLSDPEKKIREMYGAKGFILPARMTFVIDKEGIIRGVHNSQLDPKGHISFSMEILKGLQNIEKSS